MPPRTKACALCRKRRIKCDATLPQCLMCIRTGKDCPGPLDGPLIIMSSLSSGQKKPSKKATQSNNNTSKQLQTSQASDQPIFPDQIVNAMSTRIDQGALINEAFYANFLQYFTSTGEGWDIQNRRTWLHALPTLSVDGTNAALTLALRATATAYSAAESGNITAAQQSWHFYGQALQAHARVLKSASKEFTVHMISTCVMLSIFEAMNATTADAYREHINGAVKMMERTGPGQCLSGVLCQLFFHIRTQMMFVYLTTHKMQEIPADRILVLNLDYKRIPLFQRLMGHTAVLGKLYISRGDSNVLDLQTYVQTKSAVDALWLEYKTQAETRNEELSTTTPSRIQYRDGFTAVCVAYFAAARILLNVIAARLAASYPDSQDHFSTILSCAQFTRTKRIGCAYMRMATPLLLVALHSPVPEQREQAVRVFEEWKRGNMRGISLLALERIYVNSGRDRESEGLRMGMGMGMRGDALVTERLSLGGFEFEDWVGQV